MTDRLTLVVAKMPDDRYQLRLACKIMATASRDEIAIYKDGVTNTLDLLGVEYTYAWYDESHPAPPSNPLYWAMPLDSDTVPGRWCKAAADYVEWYAKRWGWTDDRKTVHKFFISCSWPTTTVRRDVAYSTLRRAIA